MIYIYKLYFEHEPNVCYIGKTSDLKKRIYAHKSAAKRNAQIPSSLWISENGIEKLRFEILAELPNDDGNEEKRQILIHKEKGFELVNVFLTKDKKPKTKLADKITPIIDFLQNNDFDGLRAYLDNDALYSKIILDHANNHPNFVEYDNKKYYFSCEPYNIDSINKVKGIAQKLDNILHFTKSVDSIFSKTNVLITSIFD